MQWLVGLCLSQTLNSVTMSKKKGLVGWCMMRTTDLIHLISEVITMPHGATPGLHQ